MAIVKIHKYGAEVGGLRFLLEDYGHAVNSSGNLVGIIRAKPAVYAGEIYDAELRLAGSILVTKSTSPDNMVCFVNAYGGTTIGAIINSREVRRGATSNVDRMTMVGSVGSVEWSSDDTKWLREFILDSGRDPYQKFPNDLYATIEKLVKCKWQNLAGAAALVLDLV